MDTKINIRRYIEKIEVLYVQLSQSHYAMVTKITFIFRLTPLFKKASKLTIVLSYFTCNSWRFLDDNLMNLSKSMSQTDRTIYNFDIACLDWKEQLVIWSIGIRKYILKDGLKYTEYALKKQRLLKYLNYIVVALYCYLWYNVLYFIVYGLGFVLRTVFSV